MFIITVFMNFNNVLVGPRNVLYAPSLASCCENAATGLLGPTYVDFAFFVALRAVS